MRYIRGRGIIGFTRAPSAKGGLVRDSAPAEKPRGFTLVELLVVTAILSVISLALYGVFNNGIKIWQEVNKQLPEENLDIFFDKLSSDLRNSFKSKGINFIGRQDRLEFATLVASRRLGGKTIGRVVYFYDAPAEVIKRERLDFSHIYTGDEGVIQELLGNVRQMKFQYYFYDTQTKEYAWQEEWLKEDLPLAVEIQLQFDNGGRINDFIKTINIPSAVLMPKKI